jgi:prepilin-type N-terminal cleavage/methylation domain-containing protein
MKQNQNGFSAIEVLAVLVAGSLIAVTAYTVGNRQQGDTQNENKTAVTATARESKKPGTLFSDTKGMYSFELPEGWSAEYVSGTENGMLGINPKGFRAAGSENDWVMAVVAKAYPGEYASGGTFANFSEFKKLTLEQTASSKLVNRELQLNGTPVWQFDETIDDRSPTGPPELSGGYYDRNYHYHHKQDKYLVSLEMRVFQHATTNYLGDRVTATYDYSKYVKDFEAIARSLKINNSKDATH